MSYLRTLAARALEQPQPIRPRLPSLFEPAAGPRVKFREITLNKHSKQEPGKAPRSQDQKAAAHKSELITSPIDPTKTPPAIETGYIGDRLPSIRPLKSVEPAPETKLIGEGATIRLTEARANEPSIESPAEHPNLNAKASAMPDAVKPDIQIAQAITIEQTNLIETAAGAAPEPQIQDRKSLQPEAFQAQTIVVKPDVKTDVSEPLLVEPQIVAEQLPSVRITIGRVDVRAIMAPVQTTTTVARQAATKALSLDEYLKQRNGEPG